MSTEFLMEKINALKGAIQQAELNRFSQQLIVEDAAETSGNQSVDDQMKSQAQSAMAQVSMEERKLVVRRKYMAEFQAEWDKLQADVAARAEAAKEAANRAAV